MIPRKGCIGDHRWLSCDSRCYWCYRHNAGGLWSGWAGATGGRFRHRTRLMRGCRWWRMHVVGLRVSPFRNLIIKQFLGLAFRLVSIICGFSAPRSWVFDMEWVLIAGKRKTIDWSGFNNMRSIWCHVITIIFYNSNNPCMQEPKDHVWFSRNYVGCETESNNYKDHPHWYVQPCETIFLNKWIQFEVNRKCKN